MTRLLVLLPLVALALPARAEPLFPSRVPYPPLVDKLTAAHQSPDKVLHPASARDLLQLTSGQRYKLVVDGAGKLAIAPLPADAPGNEYVHPILAAGAPVRTAGGITVEHAGKKVTHVSLDQDSKAYCPTFVSLKLAADALIKLGVPPAVIHLQDKAPLCAPMSPASQQ